MHLSDQKQDLWECRQADVKHKRRDQDMAREKESESFGKIRRRSLIRGRSVVASMACFCYMGLLGECVVADEIGKDRG